MSGHMYLRAYGFQYMNICIVVFDVYNIYVLSQIHCCGVDGPEDFANTTAWNHWLHTTVPLHLAAPAVCCKNETTIPTCGMPTPEYNEVSSHCPCFDTTNSSSPHSRDKSRGYRLVQFILCYGCKQPTFLSQVS